MKVRGGIKRLRRPTRRVCGYFSIYFCLFTQKFRTKCTNKHTSLPGSNKQYAIYLCKAVKPVIVLRNANMTVPRQLCNGHKMLKGYTGLVFDCLLKDVNRPRNTTWCPRIWTALRCLIQCSNAKPQSQKDIINNKTLDLNHETKQKHAANNPLTSINKNVWGASLPAVDSAWSWWRSTLRQCKEPLTLTYSSYQGFETW